MLKICATCALARTAGPDPTTATTHECRRQCPAIEPATGVGVWPRVVSSDWCGQWKAER